MRVDVFQAVAICFRGNVFLNGEEGDRAPELVGPNELFKHINELAFYRTGNLAINNGCLSVGTKSWFMKLKKEGVESLRLALDLCQRAGMPREPSGWGIVSDGDCGTELWQPSWHGILVRYDEPSAYRVSYTSMKHSPWSIRRPELCDASLSRLRSLLHETLQACIEMDLVPLFDEVKAAWSGDSLGTRIAQEILGPYCDSIRRDLVLTAIQSILLISTHDWKAALAQKDPEGHLNVLSDRLWSASLRGFESCVFSTIQAKV